MRKSVKTIMIICAAVFLISGGFLVANLLPQNNNYEQFKNDTTETNSKPLVNSILSGERLVDNPIDFSKLKQENSEVVGWIQIPDMVIDYPIMQSGMDTEEDFYLLRDINKKKNKAGSIYIQKMNFSNFSDNNTLVYGHNMRNGSMFGTLKKFRDKSFFEENDTIYIYTQGHILTYKIYSAFVYDSRHILAAFDFNNSVDYQKFIDETLNPSSKIKNVRKGVNVTTEDKIITLSTCTNNDSERYLVVAVLESDVYTN